MLHALLLLACTQPEPLTGKVVDIWNNPIEGATVIANGERPLTDDNGVYRMTAFTGETEFKAGKEGFVQDAITVTPTAENPKGPVFKLYKKPEANGFYAITVGDYLALEPSTVKLVGHAGDSIYGIKPPRDSLYVEGDTLQFVYRIDLSLSQLKKLGLELRRLKFIENTTMASVGGGQETEVAVNLWVDDGEVPITIEKLRSKGHYLISSEAGLTPGIYTLQSQDLLTPSNAVSWSRIPEPLRTVYPITVK